MLTTALATLGTAGLLAQAMPNLLWIAIVFFIIALVAYVLGAQGVAGIEAWLESQGPRLARVIATLEQISKEETLTLSRLLVAAGQLQDVAGAATAAAPSASARPGQTGGRAKSVASENRPARKRAPSSPA